MKCMHITKGGSRGFSKADRAEGERTRERSNAREQSPISVCPLRLYITTQTISKKIFVSANLLAQAYHLSYTED